MKWEKAYEGRSRSGCNKNKEERVRRWLKLRLGAGVQPWPWDVRNLRVNVSALQNPQSSFHVLIDEPDTVDTFAFLLLISGYDFSVSLIKTVWTQKDISYIHTHAHKNCEVLTVGSHSQSKPTQ